MLSKRQSLAVLGLLLVLPVLLAMGFGGSEGPTHIPQPDADYRVLLTDISNNQVELTLFSISGQNFVMGALGKGEAAVPFNKIKAVEFFQKGETLWANLTLKDGETVAMSVKPELKATGKTDFGNYRIPLAEVKALQLLGHSAAKP